MRPLQLCLSVWWWLPPFAFKWPVATQYLQHHQFIYVRFGIYGGCLIKNSQACHKPAGLANKKCAEFKSRHGVKSKKVVFQLNSLASVNFATRLDLRLCVCVCGCNYFLASLYIKSRWALSGVIALVTHLGAMCVHAPRIIIARVGSKVNQHRSDADYALQRFIARYVSRLLTFVLLQVKAALVNISFARVQQWVQEKSSLGFRTQNRNWGLFPQF